MWELFSFETCDVLNNCGGVPTAAFSGVSASPHMRDYWCNRDIRMSLPDTEGGEGWTIVTLSACDI